jgi:sigma-B regulation protein RsbU (phosphoserine phosphatase)
MPGKILLAHQETVAAQAIYQLLRDEGYHILRADNLPETERLLQQLPDLLLLDTDLADLHQANSWSDLAFQCQQDSISCLLYSSRMQAFEINDSAPSWIADTISRADDPHEVRFKVAAQLAIRRLTYEAELANRQLLKKQLQLEEYQRSAAEIQTSLLPTNLPDIAHLLVAWRLVPCEQVGGDLFNVVRLSEDMVLAYVLDVSGHGISAAMVTVSVYQSLSPHAGRIVRRPLEKPPYFHLQSPAEVLRQLEQEYPLERFGKLFTISYLLINTRTGHVSYSSAGHPPPLLVRNNGSYQALNAGGSIIGTGCSGPFEEEEIQLYQGDRLFLYSDGVTEHSNHQNQQFGQERLFRKLTSNRKRALEPACDKLIESLKGHGQDIIFKDDVTLVGIEFLGNGHGELP